MWNGSSEDDIIDALVSHEKTWEKVFYFLLMKYRTRHQEEGSRKTSSDRSARKKVQAQIQSATQGVTRSQRSTQSLSDIASGAVEVVPARTSSRTSRPVSAVIQAPTQRAEATVPTSPRSRPPLPQTPALKEEPVAPTLFAPTPDRQNNAGRTVLPTIQLQEPTPQSTERIQDLQAALPTSAPPSPTPSNNVPQFSPIIPNIAIPQVDSPAMQQFFHDVVDQLQAMALRSASPSPDVSPVIGSFPTTGTPTSEHRISFTPVIRAREQFKNNDASQFADADDDGTQAVDVPIAQQLQQMVTVPKSPQSPPLASATQPLAIRKPVPTMDAPASPLQARRSVRQAPSPQRPPMTRPTSAFVAASGQRVVVPRRGVSTIGPSGGSPIMPGSYFITGDDKENYASPPPRKSAMAGTSDTNEKKRVTLGLAIAGVAPQEPSPTFEHAYFSPPPTNSKLKRKSTQKSPVSPFLSPNPSLEAASTPKGSWFSNLFNWKSTVVSIDLLRY